MTMLTQDRAKPKRAMPSAKRMVPDAKRLVPDDVVTANGLATHLGMSRQNVARLTAEAIIEQRSDGGYDLTASRLRYIKHLRSEHRRSPPRKPMPRTSRSKPKCCNCAFWRSGTSW